MADHSQNVRPEAVKNSPDADFSLLTAEKTTDLPPATAKEIDSPVSKDSAPKDSALEENGFSHELKERCIDLEIGQMDTPATDMISVEDPYAGLVAPAENQQIEAASETIQESKTAPARTEHFQYRASSAYNKTILDRIITYIAMALEKIDFTLSQRTGRSVNKRKARSDRESELEEFMNDLTKKSIGRKLGARSKRKDDADDDSDTQDQELD